MHKAYAGGACVDGACIEGAYTDKTCTGGACTDGACTDGVCVRRACAGGACVDRACIEGACTDRACTDGACVDRACTDGAYNVVYGKSPTSPGNGGFVYIEGPTKIRLSFIEAKNLFVLMWSRTSSLVHSIWSFSHSVSYKNCAIVTYLLTHTPCDVKGFVDYK